MGNDRPTVGIFGLTGCAGDQLQILNCEDHLLLLATQLDIIDWVMVKTENDHSRPLDIAFVEGVVATERDLETVKAIRRRAGVLVALGTCAVWGGLPAMRNSLPADVLQRAVQNGPTEPTVEARPVTDFVTVDLALPGCPIERHEFLATVRAALAGTTAELPRFPVCWECKMEENLCQVIHFREVCCGSMTRSGCGARCPSHGVPCAGCRGPIEEPHYDANLTMFSGRGISSNEIGRKMAQFSAPAWMLRELKAEGSDG